MLNIWVTILPNPAIRCSGNDDTRPTKVSIPWTRGMKVHDLLSRVRCNTSKNLYLQHEDALYYRTARVDNTSRVTRMSNLELDDNRIHDGCTIALAPHDSNADGRETVEELSLVRARPDWKRKWHPKDYVLSCSLNYYHIYCGITLVENPSIETIRVVDIATSKVMTFRFRRPIESFGRGLEQCSVVELRSHIVKDVIKSMGRSFKKQFKFQVTLSSACDTNEDSGEMVCIYSENEPLGYKSIFDLNLKGPVLNAKLELGYRADIVVKTLTGKINTVMIGSSSSVHDVMVAIYHQEGVPVDQQRLVFAGEQLEPELKLSHYGIDRGSTLHLILRLRGGMYHLSSARVDNVDLADSLVNVKVLLPNGHLLSIRVQEGMLAAQVKQIVAKAYKDVYDYGESAATEYSSLEEESKHGLENALEEQQQKINRLRNELRQAELEAEMTKNKLNKHTK